MHRPCSTRWNRREGALRQVHAPGLAQPEGQMLSGASREVLPRAAHLLALLERRARKFDATKPAARWLIRSGRARIHARF